MWHELLNQGDIATLMDIFGGFHDSCIKELKYVSGAFVNPDLSMHPINSERTVKIIFQRQYKAPVAIEIEFIGLIKLSLVPENEMFTCELHGVSIFIDNDKIYWYDSDFINAPAENYDSNWICADKIRWRITDEYIGNREIYKST